MHPTWKDRRKQLYSSMPMPMPRLLTMVLMLAIMALIFVRLRDPNTWRFFARDNDDDNSIVAAGEPAAAKKTSIAPPAISVSSSEKRAFQRYWECLGRSGIDSHGPDRS